MKLKTLFLGVRSTSGAWTAGLPEAWGAIRTGLIFALSLGLVAFLESADAVDFGQWDALVSAAITTAIELIRRWAKDYEPGK